MELQDTHAGGKTYDLSFFLVHGVYWPKKITCVVLLFFRSFCQTSTRGGLICQNISGHQCGCPGAIIIIIIMGKYVKLIAYRLKSMWHRSPHMHTCTHHPYIFTVFYVFALYFWLIIFLFTLHTVINLSLLSLAESIQFSVQFLKNSSN